MKELSLSQEDQLETQGPAERQAGEESDTRIAKRFTPVALEDFVTGSLVQPRWAVENVWPERASGIIAGRPKDGKSALATELAISLWSGTPMFALKDFPTRSRPSPVLYVQQENSDQRVQRDLQAILAARKLGTLIREQVMTDDGPEVVTTFELDDYELVYRSCGNDPPIFRVLSNKNFDLSNEDDRVWLEDHVREQRFSYVFLDPLYMLASGITESGADTGPLKLILTWLTSLKNSLNVGVVITHHMSDKGSANEAASMLGSTYLHAWYEAALMTRHEDRMFRVKVDAQRDFGCTDEYVLAGLGVGEWYYAEAAQNQTDALGRNAPRTAAKETKKARLRELHAANPSWSYEELSEESGIPRSTVARYLKELRDADDGDVDV
jgi:hypothetical protein